MLTPSERELLLLKQSEMRFVALSRIIYDEASSAYKSWVQWEAINDQFAQGPSAAAALKHHQIDGEVGIVRQALSRDAIVKAYRLSDSAQSRSNSDHPSLCRLARELSDEPLYRRLTSHHWIEEQGSWAGEIENAADSNKLIIAGFTSLIVPDWSATAPVDPRLRDLRGILRDTRNTIVHGTYPVHDLATVDQIREFMELTFRLAIEARVVATGTTMCFDSFKQDHLLRAQQFWKLAFTEPIRIWVEAKQE
jgi:hypothetical protein